MTAHARSDFGGHRPARAAPRILYLTPGCFDKGGISRYSRYQITAWREIVGTEQVQALSLLGPDANAFEEAFDVRWHGRRAVATNAGRAAFAMRAALLSAMWRPDIVHVAHVNFAPLARALQRLGGATTLLNIYGREIWSGLSARRVAAMRGIDHVVADCHATAAYSREAGLRTAHPSVIWDPADLVRFTPRQPASAVLARYGIPDPARHTNVLTLGRLARAAAHKGYDRLIDAFAITARTRPDLRLVIAGRGDLRDELAARAVSAGIADITVFTGAIDEAHLADVYRSAVIFSLVSDRGEGRGEGIPLTPLEAMACGVPVIVGDEDGSREAVVDGRNGIVVSPRDPDAQVSALLALCDGATRARMAAEARKVAEENFSYESFRDKHADLLRRLLQTR